MWNAATPAGDSAGLTPEEWERLRLLRMEALEGMGRRQLLAHCDRLLAGPMPDHVYVAVMDDLAGDAGRENRSSMAARRERILALDREGLGRRAIAKREGITEGAVGSALYRARRAG